MGSNSEKIKGGSQDGPKDKRALTNKSIEGNGPKFRTIKPNKPTRGLLIDSLREENPLSSNGKRLRVEMDSVGRSRGSFTKNDSLRKEGSGPIITTGET